MSYTSTGSFMLVAVTVVVYYVLLAGAVFFGLRLSGGRTDGASDRFIKFFFAARPIGNAQDGQKRPRLMLVLEHRNR